MSLIRLVAFLFLTLSLYSGEPETVFLTIEEDPMTTVVINHLLPIEANIPPIEYTEENQNDWHSSHGELISFPLDMPYLIHRIKLTALKPNTGYTLKLNNHLYHFRTQPGPEHPFRFIVAGDIYEGNEKIFVDIAKVAASMDPHLAALGGDIAYAHEKSNAKEGGSPHRWIEWLKLWSQHMVTPTGYMIPMVSAIGNHDTVGRRDQSSNDSPAFYTLFQKGYRAHDINSNISILTLDTGHSHPINGKQTTWLEKAMREREYVPFTFAVYHVPAWPSCRKFKGKRGALIRKHWVPIFDRHQLTAAFEHHEHSYKRTFPLKDLKKDVSGTFYLGNGGFGVTNIRQPKNHSEKWYLAHTAATQHFFFIEIIDHTLKIQAVDGKGRVFDQISKS